MDTNAIFRIAMLLLFIGYLIPRSYFRSKARKTRKEAGVRTTGMSESKWRLILMGLSGLGVNLVGLLWVINPDWLAWSNLDLPLWLRWIGLAIGAFTVVMSYFVHRTLGRNFTPTLETPDGQRLIMVGIYTQIRHPMYTTFILLFLSSFLMSTNWLIAVFGLIYGMLIIDRVNAEEAMMVVQFGQEYQEYMKRSGRFFPPLSSST